MTERKLDVLIVTKNPELSEKFHSMINESEIPTNRIIVETSKPLGPARDRAIQKVTTERFVWLDDDVWLPKGWYSSLMKYWTSEKIGWLEGLALPSSPKWYADWSNYTFEKNQRTVQKLGYNERSFNCCAVVVTEALSDWHYPQGPYLGFGSEDLLMSNHVTRKGYERWRVPLRAEHRLNYTGSIWNHISSGSKGLGSLKENHKLSIGMKYAVTCLGSGCLAAVHTKNPEIIPNALHWSWCWFRDLAL